MTGATELLGCPFCGNPKPKQKAMTVDCGQCCARIYASNNVNAAIKWNTRANLAPDIGGWQPIETAPKDGAEILGFRDDAGVMLIRWTAPIDFLTEAEIDSFSVGNEDGWQEVYGWFYADFIHGDRLECGDPTHWMPLPMPPKVKS